MDELETYAKELEISGSLTLSALIASHRRLRERNSRNNESSKLTSEEIAEQRRLKIEALAQMEANQEYISLERLRGMTLQEISELLA